MGFGIANLVISCILSRIMTTQTTNTAPFAVIATGGKQYVVRAGDTLLVELLNDNKEGDKLEFDALMTDDGKAAKVGAPNTGSTVKATYLGEKKGKKLTIVRYKAKSNRDRRIGHRQHYAEIKIDAV